MEPARPPSPPRAAPATSARRDEINEAFRVRAAAYHQQEVQRSAARGRQEADAEFARERQELLAENETVRSETVRLRAELQDARRDVATNGSLHFAATQAARSARAQADVARAAQAAATAAAQQQVADAQQRADRAIAEAEVARNAFTAQAAATAAAQRVSTLARTATAHAQQQSAAAQQQTDHALAERGRLRSELQDARREVTHGFAEAEAARNALAAQAAQVNTLLARVQRQNSTIAGLENLDREAWGGLRMGIVEDGGNVVLSPGAAALVHFAMPGNPCLPPSRGRPRGSSQLFPRPADTAFPYAFSAEIAWLQDEWGSPNRGRRNRFELTRIVVEDNPDVRAAFISNIARNEAPRARGTNPAMLPDFGSVDAADQQVKDNVLAALQICFLARMGLQNENLLLVFHGASLETVDDICEGGFMQLNHRDNGFFGQGLYTTTYPEHACMYGTGEMTGRPNTPNADGEFVVLACYASPGRTYPISRRTDYAQPDDPSSSSIYCSPRGQPAASLRNQFQSHFVCLDGNYQCADDVTHPGTYDELVLQSSAQLLPAYRLYFQPVPGLSVV